jgi:hypothetical protein
MQGHRVGDIESDGLGYQLGVFGKLARRKTVLARQRIQRRPQHVVSGGAAQAAVEAERAFLLDGSATRLEIMLAEVTAQQRLQVR